MTPQDWTILIISMIGLYFLLTLVVYLFRKRLFLGVGEREKILQNQIDKLQRKLEDSDREIDSLRKQVNFLVEQNEESVRKLVNVEKINEELKEEIDIVRRSSEPHQLDNPQRVLTVVIGSQDSGLSLDLASIRAVKADTGLDIQTIYDATPENLKRVLDIARRRNQHIYIHMAVKADREGYLIGDKVVDANWLSSILEDVIVLLVAGSNSHHVGEFLGVAHYVITVSGDISHEESARFARKFWTEIGKGIGPTLALKRALDASPDEIRQKIVKHW